MKNHLLFRERRLLLSPLPLKLNKVNGSFGRPTACCHWREAGCRPFRPLASPSIHGSCKVVSHRKVDDSNSGENHKYADAIQISFGKGCKVIQGARALPVQHLTIRVPWHDSGWNGAICQVCTANTCCIVLPRIATGRDDAFEMLHAGESIEALDRSLHPPCVDEHGTFMAKFPLSMQKRHPYAESAKTTHGHFAETPYTIRPYSAAG